MMHDMALPADALGMMMDAWMEADGTAGVQELLLYSCLK
jgi:hypothetical protein